MFSQWVLAALLSSTAGMTTYNKAGPVASQRIGWLEYIKQMVHFFFLVICTACLTLCWIDSNITVANALRPPLVQAEHKQHLLVYSIHHQRHDSQ